MQKWQQWEIAGEAAWSLALHRETVIRPLAEQPRLSAENIAEAANQLGLSRSILYKLLERYRRRPQTSSLLPWKRGRKPDGIHFANYPAHFCVWTSFLPYRKRRVSSHSNASNCCGHTWKKRVRFGPWLLKRRFPIERHCVGRVDIGRMDWLPWRSFEQQRYRASGLTLVTAAIVLWNTVYIEKAVRSKSGAAPDPQLLKYLSPLGWEHINLIGDYQWRNSKIALGKFRPLRTSTHRLWD